MIWAVGIYCVRNAADICQNERQYGLTAAQDCGRASHTNSRVAGTRAVATGLAPGTEFCGLRGLESRTLASNDCSYDLRMAVLCDGTSAPAFLPALLTLVLDQVSTLPIALLRYVMFMTSSALPADAPHMQAPTQLPAHSLPWQRTQVDGNIWSGKFVHRRLRATTCAAVLCTCQHSVLGFAPCSTDCTYGCKHGRRV